MTEKTIYIPVAITDEYSPEGEDVIVTDGINFDKAYFVWSSEYRYIKLNTLTDTQEDMGFKPTHWLKKDTKFVFDKEELKRIIKGFINYDYNEFLAIANDDYNKPLDDYLLQYSRQEKINKII